MAKSASGLMRVAWTERFSVEAQTKLRASGLCELVPYTPENWGEIDALIIRSKTKVTSEFLYQHPRLQFIATCTSGYDHIDFKETQSRDLVVAYTPEANVQSAAEQTWAILLSVARHTVAAHRELKSQNWNREPFVGLELAGKTLGIVGLGRIGQKVSKIAKAFDMQVLAFDPYQDESAFTNTGVTRVSYEELLKSSDILSFHVPFTFETKHMFNRSHIEYVNENIIVINASRGSVVHEEDLADALLNKKIKAAGLDVFEKEPLARDSKLHRCSNVVLTPHLGAFTEDAFQKASLEAADSLIKYIKSEKVPNTLPLQNNWGSLSFKERT